jgi:hypothetical protein
LLDLLFDLEDESSTFLENIGEFVPGYIASAAGVAQSV